MNQNESKAGKMLLIVPPVPATLEEFVAIAKKLRSDLATAKLVFVAFLQAGEASDIWRAHAGGDGSFSAFLDRYDICDSGSYYTGIAAREALGDAKIIEIGLDAARVAVAKLRDEEARAEAVRRLENSAREIGAPPSERTAKKIVSDIIREQHLSTPRVAGSDMDRLRIVLAEKEEIIRSLRAENADLKRKIRAYERERRSGEKKPGGARKEVAA